MRTIAAMAIAVLSSSAVFAQTVHFSNSEVPYLVGGAGDIVTDASGNIYMADSVKHQVVKATMHPDGSFSQTVITTAIANPRWVAVDRSGNVYITDGMIEDTVRHGVVKETPGPNGYTATTLFDGRSFGPIAVDSAGNLYLSEITNTHLYKETYVGGSYVETLISDLSGNFGTGNWVMGKLAVDARGDIFALSTGSGEILEFVPGSNAYTVGLRWSDLSIAAMTLDAAGNVYYLPFVAQNLEKLTYAGGSWTASSFPIYRSNADPYGMAADPQGNLYVSTSAPALVRVAFSGAGIFPATPAGSAASTAYANFTIDTGAVIGSRSVSAQGETGGDFQDVTTPAPGTCQLNRASYCSIYVSFAPAVAGTRYGSAQVLDPTGNVMASAYFQGMGVAPQVSFYPAIPSAFGSGFQAPKGVAVDTLSNVYIADSGNNRVVKQGTTNPVSIGTGLSSPSDVALDGAGNVYIADTGNHQVLKQTLQNGSYLQSVVRDGLDTPVAVAVDGGGNVYIVDAGTVKVLKETLTASGYTESTIPVRGLIAPVDVAVDGSGNLYIADAELPHAVKEVYANGVYTQSSVVGGLVQASGITVDGVGNVFVADAGRNAVIRLSYSGSAYTAQNTVVSGLNAPAGVAVDGRGNLLVANSGTNSVVSEDFADGPGFAFAPTVVGSASGYLTALFWNLGNAPLHFAVPQTGSNPSVAANFTLNENKVGACPVVLASGTEASLNAGTSCALQVQFTPTTTGSITGAVTVTDDALNGTMTQSIGLKGTGLASPNKR